MGAEIASTSNSKHASLSITNPNFILKDDEICSDVLKVSTKRIYQHIVYRKATRLTALDRWLEHFDIDDSDWQDIFRSPYIACRETKLQAMQYKIIHRIIPCNKWLFNQKINDSPNCIKCSKIDDIIYNFIRCSGVGGFWKSFKIWWNVNGNYNIELKDKDILFGLYYDNEYFRNINYILLVRLGKWYRGKHSWT